MFKSYLVTCLLAAVLAAPRPIIVDVDADVDDMWAVAWLLRDPLAAKAVEIKAITVEGNAWSNPIYGIPNMIYTLELFGCEHIPVAYGSTATTTMLDPTGNPGVGAVPDSFLAGVDKFFGCMTNMHNVTLPAPRNPENQASTYDAVELIVDILMTSDVPVDILATGSMTNIAKAIIRERKIVSKIGKLYFQGTRFDVTSISTTSWPYTTKVKGSSWNIFADPLATERVLTSGIKMMAMTSLATEDLLIETASVDTLAAKYNVPDWIKKFVLLFAPCTGQTNADLRYWDPAAAIMMVEDILYGGAEKSTSRACTEWQSVVPYVNLLPEPVGGYFGRTFDLKDPKYNEGNQQAWTCSHANKTWVENRFWGSIGGSATCPPMTTGYENAPTVLSLDSKVKMLESKLANMESMLNLVLGNLKSCDGTADKHEYCKTSGAKDYCGNPAYQFWMRQNCARTCCLFQL